MLCFRCILLLVSVLPKSSDAVKVNMQGSISLGKEVVDTLSHFVHKNELASGRRSFSQGDGSDPDMNSDTIALIINAAFLCRDLRFCQGDIGTLVNKYIIALTEAVESVFEGLIDDIDKKKNENIVIFEEELRRLIEDIQKLLITSNEKISKDDKVFTWIDLLKRVNAKFQDRAIAFATLRLEGNVQEITEVKKKLTQKLITGTTIVELQFENKLCTDHGICSDSYECTKALNAVLEHMKTVPDERAKEFIRYFYETLPGTNFYYRVSDVTGHEFQAILYDMAYADNILVKNVLGIVHKSVEERLNSITSKFKNSNSETGRDVKLVHVILSNMDHFYRTQKPDPFSEFLGDFFEWANQGGRFTSPLRRVMKEIQNMLSFESDELMLKLVNEVRVFMEITVDPDS